MPKPGTRAQTSKATITSPLGNSIKKKRETPPKANAKRTRLPVAKIDARFASRSILDEEPAVIEYEPNDHAAKEPTKPMAKANKAKAKRKANPSPAHVGTPTLEPGVPETKHDAPSHPKKNKAPPSAIKQLHAMAKKTKCIAQELFSSSSSASESEDEGYTTPPIEVESDDSSGDESEGDGSDLEIIEDYDEQLQDNDMDVMDDDSSGEEEVDDDDSSGEEDEEAESNEVEDSDDLHEPAIDIKEEVVRVITVTTDSYTSTVTKLKNSEYVCNPKISEDNYHLCVNGGKFIGTSKFDSKTKRFNVIWEKFINHLLVDKTFKGGNMGWAMPQGRMVEDFANDPDKMIVALNAAFEKFDYTFEMGCEPSMITFDFFREDHGDTQLNFLHGHTFFLDTMMLDQIGLRSKTKDGRWAIRIHNGMKLKCAARLLHQGITNMGLKNFDMKVKGKTYKPI